MPPEGPRRFKDERRDGLFARAEGRREAALAHFRAATALDPADRWNRNDAALELLALGRLGEAQAETRRLLDDAPDFAPAHRTLGLLSRAGGDRSAALGAFREAAARDGRDLWNRHDAAVELKELGRLDEAEAAFRAVADGTPLAHSLRGLGLVARAQGRHDRALDCFRSASLLLPDDPWFALDTAAALRALGNFEAADAASAVLIAAHPDFLPGFGERADLLIGLRRLDDAETILARLLVRDPGFVDAYRGLARIAHLKGDAQTALAHLRAAANKRPDDAALQMDLAGGLRAGGRWDEARRVYASLARRPETAVEARIELYACLRREAGPAAARAVLDEARALHPTHPRVLLALADDRRDRGDLTAADALYDEALAARPGFYWALVGKAMTARGRGDGRSVRDHLARAIESDPAEGHAAIELAAELRDADDPDGARAVLASVSPHSGRAAQAGMAEGLIRRASGDWSGAAAAFAEVARRFTSHVEAFVEAAEDEFRAGRADAADVLLETARRQAPDHPSLLEALARRAALRDEHDQALALLGRAAASDPARIWPTLGLARLRAVRGEAEEALALLDKAAARFGPRPEIALSRIEILRQTGDAAGAGACLAEARIAFPHHGPLRYQEAISDIDAGRFEAAEDALSRMPAPNGPEAGRLHFLRSLLAAARWDFAAAIEAGEAAVAALPGDGWVRNRLIHAALLHLDLDRAGRHLGDLAALEASANALRGKSANPSQSHYGQIYDEFRLDAEVVEALRRVRDIPPPARSAQFAELVRRHGDSTAAAILFFVERRRSGAPAGARAAVGEASIPRGIHQYWDEAALPPDLDRYAASWRVENPGFTHRIWNEASARDFLKRSPPAVLTAFGRAREPAMKADLFRLALLHEIGGIYADADDCCVSGIAQLLSSGHTMVVYQEDLGSLGNNFIAAAPRHPIVKRALDLATEAVNRGDSDILWLATGPGLLTRAAAQVLCETPAEGSGLLVLERHEFLAHVAIHCLAAYKATERHWSRTAFGRTRAQATRARSS